VPAQAMHFNASRRSISRPMSLAPLRFEDQDGGIRRIIPEKRTPPGKIPDGAR